MWYSPNDKTKPVITTSDQIYSEHGNSSKLNLPKTAILLYMSGIEYLIKNFDTEIITDKFPRFLKKCPIYKINARREICFLDGGRGAPHAVDTLETLNALGVKNVISIGMIGGFSDKITYGDIVIPNKVYCEEGTSLHYYEKIEYSVPSSILFNSLTRLIKDCKIFPTITTDAIYRQTFYKEKLWRNKGCVGVDMETSALLSVGKYLNMEVASILMVSDLHPRHENELEKWKYCMTENKREYFLCKSMNAILNI